MNDAVMRDSEQGDEPCCGNGDATPVVRISIENLRLWKCIFKSVNNVVEGGAIALRIHEEKITIRTFDKSHVSLLLLEMRCKIEGAGGAGSGGGDGGGGGRDVDSSYLLILSAAKLHLKLNMPQEQNDLFLCYFPQNSSNNLYLHEEESANCASFNRYKLTLLSDETVEDPRLPPPNQSFPFEIDLDVSILRGILENASSLKNSERCDELSFVISQSKINPNEIINQIRMVVGMGGEDEFERSFPTIHDGANDARRIELDGPAMSRTQPVAEAPFRLALHAVFPVKHILDFIKPFEPQTVRLSLIKNSPLKLFYPLDKTGQSYIQFHVAPRVNDDD